MATVLKQLGQLRPADTNPASIYSPGIGVAAGVDNLVICNTSGADATARVFLDDDGTVYSEVTALAWDMLVPTASTVVFKFESNMNNVAGNLAVRSSVSSALTFTANGWEQA